MKTTTKIWVLIIIVAIVGVVIYSSNKNYSNSIPTATTTPSTDNTTANGADNSQSDMTASTTVTTGTNAAVPGSLMTALVTYGPNGFSPATVTIAKGGTVTFKDEGGGNLWVASDPHPTHEGYSGTTGRQHCPDTAGTAFDQCALGSTYTFTFQKTGSWGYHNHVKHSDTGMVIVN